MSKKYALMKAGSPDNFQTDPSALACLLPYIPKEIHNPHGSGTRQTIVWEPAMGKGRLLQAFRYNGYDAIGSDIQQNETDDFLVMDAPRCDYIVTNPPFSLKEEFLGRCYQLRKPFALLMPITTFDSVERRKMMAQYGVEIIFPPRRINFETPNHAKNVAAGKRTNSWFYTCWFSWGLKIGRQLTFCDDPSFL